MYWKTINWTVGRCHSYELLGYGVTKTNLKDHNSFHAHQRDSGGEGLLAVMLFYYLIVEYKAVSLAFGLAYTGLVP